MINQIYVGLPTVDLGKLTAFYKAIGFEYDDMFSRENFSQFKVSKSIYLSIFPKEEYMKHMPNPKVKPELFGLVSNAVALSTREEVDALVGKAIEAGGEKFADPHESDFMYMSGFIDPEGHVWTIFSMKMQSE